MKIIISIITTFILFSHIAWSQNDIDSNKIIRVLSFNILHGATTRNDFDLDKIASVIEKADPDLVALQEVDFKTRRAKDYDLATELGWRTNMAPVFGRAMKYDNGEYGEAVLSKSSFVKTRNVVLPHSKGNEPRAALEVITVLPSGDTIAFIGTHFDHTKDEKDRIAQAQKINEVFSHNIYPTILAGDLNAVPASEPINILEEIWESSYDKDNPANTFPSGKPSAKIDYVMFLPESRWKVIETRIINDSIASDHCAYLVIFELLDN